MGKWLYSNNTASLPLEPITVTSALLCCTISLWSPAVRPNKWSASSRLSRLCCFLLCADNNIANISSGGGSLTWRARIRIFLEIVNTWTMFQWKYIDILSKEDVIHSLAEPSKMSTTSREKKYKRRKINEKRGLGFLPRFSDFCCFVYFVQFQLRLWLRPRGVATQPTAPEAKAGFNCDTVLPSTSTVTQF